MVERIIYKAVSVDNDGHTLSEKILSDKKLTIPTDTSNFGYRLSEQIELMQKIQQSLLDGQSIFLKSAA